MATEKNGKAKPSLVSFEPLGWLRARATETTDQPYVLAARTTTPDHPQSDFVEICIEPFDLFGCQWRSQVLADPTLPAVIVRLGGGGLKPGLRWLAICHLGMMPSFPAWERSRRR